MQVELTQLITFRLKIKIQVYTLLAWLGMPQFNSFKIQLENWSSISMCFERNKILFAKSDSHMQTCTLPNWMVSTILTFPDKWDKGTRYDVTNTSNLSRNTSSTFWIYRNNWIDKSLDSCLLHLPVFMYAMSNSTRIGWRVIEEASASAWIWVSEDHKEKNVKNYKNWNDVSDTPNCTISSSPPAADKEVCMHKVSGPNSVTYLNRTPILSDVCSEVGLRTDIKKTWV